MLTCFTQDLPITKADFVIFQKLCGLHTNSTDNSRVVKVYHSTVRCGIGCVIVKNIMIEIMGPTKSREFDIRFKKNFCSFTRNRAMTVASGVHCIVSMVENTL